MHVELSTQERDLLVELLEAAVRDLRVEVRRTETPKYHDELERKEASLRALLERLRALA
jgi:hypothetical protein